MTASSNKDDERHALSEGFVTADRRRILQSGALSLAGSAGCIAGEFPPGTGTGPDRGSDGPDIADPSNVKEDLRWWASIDAADGEEGRPLPLTASWNNSDFGVPFLNELIEEGHHVLPSFGSPDFQYAYAERYDNNTQKKKWEKRLENRYKPGLSYCAEHDLPVATGGKNTAGGMITWIKRDLRILEGKKLTAESVDFDAYPGLIVDGKPLTKPSPIGPIEAWRDHGRFLFGNSYMKRLAEIHPDPPLVVWLDNNEGGLVDGNWVSKRQGRMSRFVEQYGEDVSKDRVQEIVHEGYKKRYHAMFDAAREAAGGQWGEVLQFVAYNAWVWPKKGTLLRRDDVEGTAEAGEWDRFDGAMPESYQNDWQVGRGKTDYNLWSMQIEATSNAVLQDPVLEKHPDFYYANIGWEGRPARTRRSPPNYYATGSEPLEGPPAIQRWDLDRYLGWLQFSMWAQRPRTFREFRGGASPENPYYRATFDTYLEMVDRVWATDEIQEFWKHGELVENPNPPNWGGDLKRWYVLECPANETQLKSGRLRVFALALRLGEAPERRWLVFAHAPLGSVSGTTVTIPEYGDVTIDATRSGSFTIVSEADDSVETVVEGRTAPDDVTGWDSSTPLGAGDGPDVYDLQFDTLSEWSGEWGPGPNGDELITYRMTPNLASGPDAPVFGAGLVDDPKKGPVLDLSDDGEQGVWLQRGSRTNAANAKNRTFDITFKTKDTSKLQILAVTGWQGGYNIYLHDGKLYSGQLVRHSNDLTLKDVSNMENYEGNDYDGDFGHFLSADAPSAGEWHRATVVLEDAKTNSVEPNKRSLYIDGKRVDRGPGAAISQGWGPHVGYAKLTFIHTGELVGKTQSKKGFFDGQLSEFKLVNEARPPE